MFTTKRLFRIALAVLLAVLFTVMPAGQVIVSAQNADTGAAAQSAATEEGKYISELRVGLGKTADEAASSLAGYAILKDGDGNYADLNEGAGSDALFGSKGDKVVLLGYKTTNDINDAVTDLAVMNMDGGYSVQDYEALMDRYLDSQIRPLIDNLKIMLNEYRKNYSSSVPDNQKRAQYVHDALNKLYDDDTESYLGDLLLSETKQELEASSSDAYDSLPEAEKKKHADLETIICQSNGQATLMIENLLTRATDTTETTWIERFAVIDPSEMAAVYFPGMQPTDANSLLAGMFGDDTDRILSKWSELRIKLESYDSAVEHLENFDYEKLEGMIEEISAFDPDIATPERAEEIAAKLIEVQIMQTELADWLETVALHDYLNSVVYLEEFTMLDFFSQTLDELRADKSVLYPMAAALSAGQRAGLDFISLRELILLCTGNSEQYVNTDLSGIDTASIYEGVDRGIYEKGGVALTSEALRRGAATVAPDEYKDSTLTSLFFAITMSAAGFAAFTLVSGAFNKAMFLLNKMEYNKLFESVAVFTQEQAERVEALREGMITLSSQTKMCMQLTIGITLLAVIAGSITVYLTYRDMCEYYHTEFSPIPLYMVDESDITAVNAKGETIVIKNQKAYYKAVLCNRTEADEKYAEIGDKADLNGDVGRMWIALYSVKNPALAPILADSFKVVYGSDNAPLEYTKGIHKFGSQAAFDLNNTYYAWNHGRDGIYVYYKTDDAVPRGTGAIGSITSAGALAACGGAGLLVGLLAGLFIMRGRGRKKVVSD